MLKGGAGGGSSSISGGSEPIMGGMFGQDNGIDPNGPAKEYKSVGMLVGEFMWTFRISMGDFSAIGATNSLSKIES